MTSRLEKYHTYRVSIPTIGWLLLAGLCAGCSNEVDTSSDSDTSLDSDTTPLDVDGDGASILVDCDDSDAEERPGVTWFSDADGDGHGDPRSSSECERNALSDVLVADDCDDTDAEEFPGVLWYPDRDGDGFGGYLSVAECDRLSPSDVANTDDCDDWDAERYPGVTWYQDADADGYGDPNTPTDCRPNFGDGVLNDGDCDDSDPRINPDELEIGGNGIDENCDGSLVGVTEQLLYALITPRSGSGVYSVRTLGVSSEDAWVIGDDFVTTALGCVGCDPGLVSSSVGNLYFGSNGSGQLLTINQFDSDGRPSGVHWNRMPLGLVAHGLFVDTYDLTLHGWGATTNAFALGALSTNYLGSDGLVGTGNAGVRQVLPLDIAMREADREGAALVGADPPRLSRITHHIGGRLLDGPTHPVPLVVQPTHIVPGVAPWWYVRDNVSGLLAIEYIEDESPPYLEALDVPLSLSEGMHLEWLVEDHVLVTVADGALTTILVQNHSQFTIVDSEPIPHTIAHITPAVGAIFVGTTEGAIWRVGASSDGQLQAATQVVPIGSDAVVGLVAPPID